MPYSLSLRTALLIVGVLLVLLGAMGLTQGNATKSWLFSFPRSRFWGVVLIITSAAWFWWLIFKMDLGEFEKWRTHILVVIPVAAFLAVLYMEEFLAARALGMLVLLAAEPLLEAAFLRPEISRLFLVTLVYVAIVAAMFWIGMPYVLRDQVRWVSSTPKRLQVASGVFVGYGLVLLLSATLA